MHSIGLDIGTTTICACVTHIKEKRVVKTYTEPNDSFIKSENPWEKIQEPKIILAKIYSILDEITLEFSDIKSIAISGQMHGVLYLDENNEPVSPLYIWQDQRGDLPYKNKTYAKELFELTSDGLKANLASGFGSVTNYYNTINKLIPKQTKKLCTIADYVATNLVQSKGEIFIHSSNAASLGLYDFKNANFRQDLIEKAGMDFDLYPQVKDSAYTIGKYKNISVGVSIGDNQAAFTGSVRKMEDSVLVNMGTGSQISVFIPEYVEIPSNTGCEIRPLNEGQYIIVGSSLCGGRAYAILENFIRECAKLAGCEPENLYKQMDKLSEDAFNLENKLNIQTTFTGTRLDPTLRGSIENIGLENFTPTHFVVGVLEGSVNELYSMFDGIKHLLFENPKRLVGSGNGIRKSDVWKKLFEKKFSLSLSVPVNSEEAAFGACLFGMVSAGIYSDIQQAQADMIQYEQ